MDIDIQWSLDRGTPYTADTLLPPAVHTQYHCILGHHAMYTTTDCSCRTRVEGAGTLSDTEAAAALDTCVRQLAGRYDPKNGGFGDAPKFPRPSEINALLCDHLRCTAGNATVEARTLLPSTALRVLATNTLVANPGSYAGVKRLIDMTRLGITYGVALVWAG